MRYSDNYGENKNPKLQPKSIDSNILFNYFAWKYNVKKTIFFIKLI